MDRNTDRYWYDRGYSLGVVETQRDAAIPRIIGALSLFGLTVWNEVVAAVFLGLYVVWTLSDWRDRRDEADHKRDVHDPGKEWEWE